VKSSERVCCSGCRHDGPEEQADGQREYNCCSYRCPDGLVEQANGQWERALYADRRYDELEEQADGEWSFRTRSQLSCSEWMTIRLLRIDHVVHQPAA
jgi:hypothetical protein